MIPRRNPYGPELSLEGKKFLITGATSGIGWSIARALARNRARVILAGRNRDRTFDRVRQLREESRNREIEPVVADLLLQREVRALADRVRTLSPRLDGLINNAGAIYTRREETEEGVERTWALNVVAPFLLTRLLIENLRAAAPSRVLMVASEAHRSAHLDLLDLEVKSRYSGLRAYSRSKLALILLAHEYSRRLRGTGVVANSVHPGLVRSRFGRENGGVFAAAFFATSVLFGISADRGAETPVLVATSPAFQQASGLYCVRGRSVASSPASYDLDSARRLWSRLEEMTGERPSAEFSNPEPSDSDREREEGS